MVAFLIYCAFSFVLIAILLNFALFTIWLERKASALQQDRIGANRAAIFGFDLAGVVNTLIADPIKALMKEDWLPRGATQFMHSLAPFLAVFPIIVSFSVIPFAPAIHTTLMESGVLPLQFLAFDCDLLFIFAAGGLAVFGNVLGGWVSNNKFSMYGALRAASQMISYELVLGLSAVSIVIIYGSFSLADAIEYQSGTLFYVLPKWGVFLNPLAFILLFVAQFAETKRAPFDLPESESELVAGYLTEYSGMKFMLFWLGEFSEVVITSAIIVILFFGGWQLPYYDIRELPANL